MRCLALITLLAACGPLVSAEWMVCYFSSWAVYRPGQGRFDVDDMDPFACTHAVFGFAGLSNHTWTIEVLDPWNENCPNDDPPGNGCAYQRFVALKNQNPDLKAILAVGGWNEGSEDYSTMVRDPSKRKTFIDSCIALVEKEGFDGLDIDWEYPTQRGGSPEDKKNFVTLLDEFRVEFDKRGLIMTAALASGKPTVDPSYDVAGLIRNLDVFSIMTYDYHGAWENTTHHNSPLCGYPSDTGNMTYFNVVFSIQYWLSLGIPAEKTVMGIPLYGRCFTLTNIEDHGMLAPAGEPGKPGPYTRLPGTQGWNEICMRIKDTQDCTVVHDPYLYEPYMWCKKDKLWCGYDDEESVTTKARFAKNMGLAGAMVWTIDTDDFKPTCGDRRFSLINAAKDAMTQPADASPEYCTKLPSTTAAPTEPATTEPETTPSTTLPTTHPTTKPTTEPTTRPTTEPTTKPTSKPTEPPTTAEPETTHAHTTESGHTTPDPTWPSKPDCDEDPDRFFYPHSDCNKYWWCVNGGAQLYLCPPGTYFNPETNLCDHPDNVDTSHCRVWTCEADGVTYAGADCDEYYECEHGEPSERHCSPGLYFNPAINRCDHKANVDTSTCNIPE